MALREIEGPPGPPWNCPLRGRLDTLTVFGAAAFAKELDGLGVEYTLDLFEGGHMGIQYRYPGAIAELAKALAP